MNEYVVVSTPPKKTRFGLRKSQSRISAELGDILNTMACENWSYIGDKMGGELLVFSREVPMLDDENQSDVARALVSEPLDKPIVLRRPRPANPEGQPQAQFQSRNAARNDASPVDNIFAMRG